MKQIAVLGSTGSIGTNCLDVVDSLAGEAQVAGLAAHRSWEQLGAQSRRFTPRWAVIADEALKATIRREEFPPQTELLFGPEGVERLASAPEVDVVVSAIVGAAGLRGTWAALEAGKRVALANKETLIVAGPLVMDLAGRSGATLLPVDSEHSAIFQAMQAGRREEVRRVVLTASGGPFRGRTAEQLNDVTPQMALAHPTWNMGAKITVDSATLMNKALEVIEARWLFGLEVDQIEVVLHPQSIVHSLVEFVDGSVIAQLSPPDMKLPIQYALTWPERTAGISPRLDWSQAMTLEFSPPDYDAFPALQLGFEVARRGGTCGAVLNAANEVAVERFLAGSLTFTDIPRVCRAVLDAHEFDPRPTLTGLLRLDGWARGDAPVEPLFALIDLGSLLNILYVAIGLTFVILFHELGHFAVAKWCDVQVERFSIGFGPILLRYKRGETEYALSAIPFGGYVKMLGQDDTDPSQMSAEEIAQDPRSYSSKSVLQRMGIISAGVIMNVATGLLFFAGGFALGVEEPAPYVGDVAIGLPAWRAGIEVGDRITSVNGRDVEVFSDVSRAVALTSTDTITVEGVHRDGKPFKTSMQLDGKSTRPRIGVSETRSLTLFDLPGEEIPVTVVGSAAADAKPPFQQGDTIVRIDKQEVSSFPDLQDVLARRRSETVHFIVQRKGDDALTDIEVEPRRFRTLGLWMGMGPVTAVRTGSPAARQGLKVDDVIVKVDGQEVGTKLNPLRLPDYFASKAGEQVEIVVHRPQKGGDPQELTLTVVPDDKPGWVERPDEGQPVSVPALGVAFQMTSTVLNVVAGSPADGKIQREQRIRKLELFLPPGAPDDGIEKKDVTIDFDAQDPDGATINNWAYAFWMIQAVPTRNVRLYVNSPGEGGKDKEEIVEIVPAATDEDWYLPTRGIHMMPLLVERKAGSVGEALSMGLTHTRNNMTDIYLTLRSLFGGRISVKELHGPIGIATVAYRVVSRGLPDFLLFLGFLSVNLAVINFLPIPVLDGGHMVFLIWEAVTRRKPSERVLIAATYAGMAVVLGLMMLVLYLDIFVHWLPGK